MTDENKTEDTTETVEEHRGDSAPAANRVEDLPDWAQQTIRDLRVEAANYRTKNKETEARLAQAKTVEEFEQARAEYTAQIAALEASILRAQVARKHNLPDELAARLRGDTAEALEADAKTLARFAIGTPEPKQLKGGLSPEADVEDNFDPIAVIRKQRRRA